MLMMFIVVLGFVMIFWAACKQPTEVDAPGCQNNHAPNLFGLNFEIDGTPATSSQDLVITTEQELWVYYQYEDEDCNLSGGKIYIRMRKKEWGEWKVAEILPDGTPCSYTDDPNSKVGIKIFPDFYYNYYPLPADQTLGTYDVETVWVDDCSVRSDLLDFYFVLTDAPIDDDDDSSADNWGLINNGGFEDGQSYWQESSGTIIKEKKNLDRLPFQGDWAAEFKGSNINEPRLKQGFTIPAGTTRLDLVFYYNVTSDDNSNNDNDLLKVELTDVSGQNAYKKFVVISNKASTNNYQKYSSFFLVPENLEGEEVFISFQTDFNDDGLNTVFIIDNVTLSGD